MSRIGNAPITIPSEVEIKLDDNKISVKGPKGKLEKIINSGITVDIKDNVVYVKRSSNDKKYRSLHGLMRSLINNMVIGVTKGFKKELEIHGVGYRAQKQGEELTMNLGFSHPVIVKEIEGIKIDVKDQNMISISGYDKQKVGQFAAEVRSKRPPEPYKGKGIRYLNERVKLKEGKAGKGAK